MSEDSSPAGPETQIKQKRLRLFAKIIIFICIAFILTDLVYKTVYNISYQNREECLIYSLLPEPLFLAFEYFFEFPALVVAGVFAALLLEKYFSRFSGLMPRGPFTAFLYGSLIPVCACTVIPLVQAMKEKLKFRTVITFIVAAPLLSPVIIILSFSSIGWQYGLLRIGASLITAVSSGFVLEFFRSKANVSEENLFASCRTKYCPRGGDDAVLGTYAVVRGILPYLVIAGVLAVSLDLFVSRQFIEEYDLSGSGLSLLIAALAGIPLYFCNGAEILFVKPLMEQWYMPLGTAVTFSLTSTAVCATTFVMLWRFLGRKLTIILMLHLLICSLLLGFLINLTF